MLFCATLKNSKSLNKEKQIKCCAFRFSSCAYGRQTRSNLHQREAKKCHLPQSDAL